MFFHNRRECEDDTLFLSPYLKIFFLLGYYHDGDNKFILNLLSWIFSFKFVLELPNFSYRRNNFLTLFLYTSTYVFMNVCVRVCTYVYTFIHTDTCRHMVHTGTWIHPCIWILYKYIRIVYTVCKHGFRHEAVRTCRHENRSYLRTDVRMYVQWVMVVEIHYHQSVQSRPY